MTTETITWHKASDTLPDSDMTVLVHSPSASEPVWLGYWDGRKWRDTDHMEIGPVVAWADLPVGGDSSAGARA